MSRRWEINVYTFGQAPGNQQCVQDDERRWLVRYRLRGGKMSAWVPYAGVGAPPNRSHLPVLVLRREPKPASSAA